MTLLALEPGDTKVTRPVRRCGDFLRAGLPGGLALSCTPSMGRAAHRRHSKELR